MNKKRIMFISIVSALILLTAYFLVDSYAAEEDLSNLDETTSVTVTIGTNQYTVNNSKDLNGLLNLKNAIEEYRENTELNSYQTIYEQSIQFLINNAENTKAENIENTIYFKNNKFYTDIETTNILYKEDGTEYITLEEIINNATEDLVVSILTQYTVKTDESWEPQHNIILFRGESDGKRFIEVSTNKTLTMKPTETGTLTIDGYKTNIRTTYTPIRAASGSVINVYDRVTIKDFYCTTNGGSMYLNGGTINIYGGIFYGNQAGATGGFITCTDGTFNVYDGIFANNSARTGGGVFTIKFTSATSGYINLTGGVFVNNTSESNGAVIHMTSGTFTMENATIYNNTSNSSGGFLYISAGKLSIDKSLIYDNVAQNNGGAIYMAGGEIEIHGGNLGLEKDDLNNPRKNIATTGNGGAIYIKTGTITINGGDISSNISETANGGAIYVDGGTFTINDGNINNNETTNNGGGVYVNGGTFTMNGGNIYSNKAINGGGVFVNDGNAIITAGNIGLQTVGATDRGNSASKNGGGINVAGGNVTIEGGAVSNNTSINNGGGLYLDGGTFDMNSGNINYNISENGAGAFITNTTFNLTGGEFNSNIATSKGGGFYVGDNSTVNLSNGEVKNNKAKNGSGFYQTQTSNNTTTELTGNCIVTNNEATNGNGGGVYIDGGSIFRMIGGKIIYNNATANQSTLNVVTAKESTEGVGGGVYILNGTFTMYDDDDTAGNAAIYGNIASYAADDLFASGENTSFDAISVINMDKADAYKTADSWFEDFPENEEHTTLNYEHRNDDNSTNDVIISTGRYKNITDVDDKLVATTVLNRNCNDYIAITMGNSFGKMRINVVDSNVLKAHSFIYKIESCTTEECNETNPEIVMEIVTQKGNPAIITDMPTGLYRVTVKPTWSWRYDTQTIFEIVENSVSREKETTESVIINVYSEQFTDVNTEYTINNKHWIAKTEIITR